MEFSGLYSSLPALAWFEQPKMKPKYWFKVLQKKVPTALLVVPANGSSLVERDHYKGIFYVRLSTLPVDQKVRIRTSSYRHAVIKILKDDFLMNDCMPYADYEAWHLQNYLPANTHTQQDTSLDLAFSTRELTHHS
jgi:hypothetical protein